MKESAVPQKLAEQVPLVVGLLLVFDSLHFIFARAIVPIMPASIGGFYVLAAATVQFGLFALWTGRLRWAILRRHWRFFAVIGALVAGATGLSFTSVAYVDAGTASMLSRSATLFSVLLGVIWLRDRLNRVEVLGAAVAVAGVFTISFQPGAVLRLGSLFVLGSALLYALHVAVAKRYGDEIEFTNFFFFRVASTTFFLFVLVVLRGEWQLPPTPRAWLFFAFAGFIDVIVSRVLYYWALRRLQLSHHALLLTLSPVVTIGWSMLLFGERPTLYGFAGGLAVIAGIMIINRGQALNQASPTLPVEAADVAVVEERGTG